MLISENIKNKLIFGLIGFSATGIQIVFLREFFEVFNGNELSLGIVLAAWLFWTAIGSYLFGKIFSSKLELIRIIIIFEILIAVIAPITLTAIKLMSPFLKSTPTEVLGLLPMIITAFALLPFFGIISGGLFPTAVLLFKDQNQKARAIGRVYLVESIGSAFAGILLSLVLINFFTNLSICIMISIINCVFAVFLTSCLSQKKFNFTIYLLGFIWIAGILVSYNSIQSAIRIYSWKDFKLVAEVKSHFGRYSLIQTGKSKTMYLNGTSLFTIPDQAGAEESVHFALLQHPQPKNILLLGGGLNGSINEMLKYSSVKLIDYVETDKRLIEFFKSDFSEQWREMNDDSRVKVHIIDARIFLRQQAMKYDVIILNQPDPQTAQLNRFFTVEFFRMVADRLNPSGIFSLQTHGSENYINNALADYLRCIYYSLSKVFTNVIVYPGDIIHFFAGNDSSDLTNDYHILIQRMQERHLQTQYIREYYLPFRLSPERIEYLNRIIQSQSTNRINRDFHPSAYYFNMILWSTQFSQFFINFIRWIETLNWKIVFSIISILFTVFMIYFYKSNFQHQITGAFSILCLGFTSLSTEILILLIFQILHGYIYQQLAILIAAFMAGISLGTYLSLRYSSPKLIVTLRQLLLTHLAIAVFVGLMPFFFKGLGTILNPSFHEIVLPVVFIFIAFIAGGFGGYQFPLAGLVYYNQTKEGNTGILYSLDLLGAMIGALLLSSIIIPLSGIINTSMLIAGLNIFIACLLFILLVKKY